jgi:hypothetical protein
MEDGESTPRLSAMQSAPLVLQRRDGSWVVAYNDDGVTRIGKLTVVPDRTDLDRFEDEFWRARKMLQDGVAAGLVDDALALFDFRMSAALEALREALKP